MTIHQLEKLGLVTNPEPLSYKSLIKIFNKPRGIVHLLPDLETGETVLVPSRHLKLTVSGNLHHDYNPQLVQTYLRHAAEVIQRGDLTSTRKILLQFVAYAGQFGDYDNIVKFTQQINDFAPAINDDSIFQKILYESLSTNLFDSAALIQRRLLAYLNRLSSEQSKVKTWYSEHVGHLHSDITNDLLGALKGSVFYNLERMKLLQQ